MHLGNGDGSPSSRVMIVGEMWGYSEVREGRPFAGSSGEELNRMLHEAGFLRSECYVTNVVNAMPPQGMIDNWIPKKRKDIRSNFVRVRDKLVDPIVARGLQALLDEISLIKPNLILAAGTTALWALGGQEGILKWRGSQLMTDPETLHAQGFERAGEPRKLIPIIHPAAVMREWSLRRIVIQDLRRAAREVNTREYANVPQWRFITRPSFDQTINTLNLLIARLEDTHEPLWIDFDLETRVGHIESAGLSWSREDAICIPFMCREDRQGYWALPEQETAVVWRLYRVLTHRNVRVRLQNGLYDCQYTYRHWHFVPRVAQDTMIAQHSIYCGLRKSLDFQASMYCDHYVYWKDDGKVADLKIPEDRRWRYNCEDCVRTREVGEVEAGLIKQLGLEAVDAFQQKMFWPVLQCMQRGVRIDRKLRDKLATQLHEEIAEREAFFVRVLGHPLNPRSAPQMQKLFYEDFKQKPNWKVRGKGMPSTLTCDDHALAKIANEEPLLRPLIKKIQELRSLGVFLSTFVLAPLDVDGRMRTSYNIAGTETFRFASAENAFGSGTNLQNIPKGGDDDEGFELPNIREIFIPDEGYEIFDTDLSKADLRIVVWESGEDEMKAMLREGRDPYVEAAREFYRDPSIKKTRADGSENPKYRMFKSFAHGTHYLGTPHGLSQRLGLSVHDAERTQRWYFGKYPKIRLWQEDFKKKVAARRYVENIFGYRRYYFDRPDDAMMREAIAWLPQSTVALYINRIWMNLYEKYSWIWILLQVHDSLVGQYPLHRRDESKAAIADAAQIVLPYPDPLVIPVGMKSSTKSWGACE